MDHHIPPEMEEGAQASLAVGLQGKSQAEEVDSAAGAHSGNQQAEHFPGDRYSLDEKQRRWAWRASSGYPGRRIGEVMAELEDGRCVF